MYFTILIWKLYANRLPLIRLSLNRMAFSYISVLDLCRFNYIVCQNSLLNVILTVFSHYNWYILIVENHPEKMLKITIHLKVTVHWKLFLIYMYT